MADHAYRPEPGEVDTLLHNLLGDVLDVADPLIRYEALTREQAVYDVLVSAIKTARIAALAAMRDGGSTLEQIAEQAGLGTYQRVQKLLAAAR